MKKRNSYVRVIDYIFFREKEIRDAVYAARNDVPKEIVAGGGAGHIGKPTESLALRNIEALGAVVLERGGEVIKQPEKWLRVIDETYRWCDHDQLIVAKDKYSHVDYRKTCAKLSISQSTHSSMVNDIRHYASLCAAQLGLIKIIF